MAFNRSFEQYVAPGMTIDGQLPQSSVAGNCSWLHDLPSTVSGNVYRSKYDQSNVADNIYRRRQYLSIGTFQCSIYCCLQHLSICLLYRTWLKRHTLAVSTVLSVHGTYGCKTWMLSWLSNRCARQERVVPTTGCSRLSAFFIGITCLKSSLASW